MTIIDKIKGLLGKPPRVSPSMSEPVDYYEYSSSGSSATESWSISASPSAEYRPSEVYAGPSYANIYADDNMHADPPNHTMMSYTTSSLGIRDPAFNTETERLPRPVKVKKSPVVKISNERQNRKLDNDK